MVSHPYVLSGSSLCGNTPPAKSFSRNSLFGPIGGLYEKISL